jgi:hypothetical protein
MREDPFQHVLDGLSATIAMLPIFLAEMERVRGPWSEAERNASAQVFAQQVDATIARRAVQFNWRAVLVSTAAAIIWSAIVGAGVWWWSQSHLTEAVVGIERRLTGPEAEDWRTLIQNNHLPAVLAAAEKAKDCGPQNGREACLLPLWTGPLPPPSLTPAQR